jgi:hypothetical protein
LRSAATWTLDPEGGLFDDRTGPRTGDQLFFCDRLAGALDERNQNVERSAADARRVPVLEKRALRRDQPERSEGEDLFIHRGSVLSGVHNWQRSWRIFASSPVAARRPAATRDVTCKQCKNGFAQLCNP